MSSSQKSYSNPERRRVGGGRKKRDRAREAERGGKKGESKACKEEADIFIPLFAERA